MHERINKSLYQEVSSPSEVYYPTVNRLQTPQQRLEELRQELKSLSPTSEKEKD